MTLILGKSTDPVTRGANGAETVSPTHFRQTEPKPAPDLPKLTTGLETTKPKRKRLFKRRKPKPKVKYLKELPRKRKNNPDKLEEQRARIIKLEYEEEKVRFF